MDMDMEAARGRRHSSILREKFQRAISAMTAAIKQSTCSTSSSFGVHKVLSVWSQVAAGRIWHVTVEFNEDVCGCRVAVARVAEAFDGSDTVLQWSVLPPQMMTSNKDVDDDNAQPPAKKSRGLSSAAIVAIVCGCLAAVGIAAFLMSRRRRADQGLRHSPTLSRRLWFPLSQTLVLALLQTTYDFSRS